jgi:Domain of unknown function (DUF4309)
MKQATRKSLRKFTTIGMAAMISLGALAAVTPAHAASSQPAAVAQAQSGPAYIKSILALAKKGKVPNCNFVSGVTNIKQVHKEWGRPEQSGNGYETYNFGMGRGKYAVGISSKTGNIFDLRDFGQSIEPSIGIKSMTFASVIATLGMPKAVKFSGSDKIYVYPAGEHLLKFVGPMTAPKGQSSHIDHINVYTPKADV